MSTNTAFLLIPGSFSPTTIFSKLIPLLSPHGTVYSVPLQSAGHRPQGPATFSDDVAYIRAQILSAANEGKDIVLGMSSYGGIPGTEATLGLSRKERQAREEKGGVVALVYLASFLPKVGESLKDIMKSELPNSIRGEIPDEYMHLNYDKDWKNIFSDLGEDEAKYWINQMIDHSTISFDGTLTYPGYQHIPSVFLLTTGDKIIPPEKQRDMIADAEKIGTSIEVVEINQGHVPVLSAPEKVTKVLIAAARKWWLVNKSSKV